MELKAYVLSIVLLLLEQHYFSFFFSFFLFFFLIDLPHNTYHPYKAKLFKAFLGLSRHSPCLSYGSKRSKSFSNFVLLRARGTKSFSRYPGEIQRLLFFQNIHYHVGLNNCAAKNSRKAVHFYALNVKIHSVLKSV